MNVQKNQTKMTSPPLRPPAFEVSVLVEVQAQLPEMMLPLLAFDSKAYPVADLRAIHRSSELRNGLLYGTYQFSTPLPYLEYSSYPPEDIALNRIQQARAAMVPTLLVAIGAALALSGRNFRPTVRTSKIECTAVSDGKVHWEWVYAVTICRFP